MKKLTPSQKRYAEYKDADSGLSYPEWCNMTVPNVHRRDGGYKLQHPNECYLDLVHIPYTTLKEAKRIYKQRMKEKKLRLLSKVS